MNTVNGNESLYNTGNLKVEKKVNFQDNIASVYFEKKINSGKVIKVNIIAFHTF